MKRSTMGKRSSDSIFADVVARSMPGLPAGDWLPGLALVLAVFFSYLPVWNAGFLWDDRFYITENPYLLNLTGLKLIWTSSAADISPLTSTTFWVEHALWGLIPLPYHLLTLLLHAACAVMLWRVLLDLRVPGAWLGAALWALHPVQVESVAWVTETKNTESGLFFLLAIFFFGRWGRAADSEPPADHRGSYLLAFVFAGLAMASKSSTVILPVVFCLQAWWIEGRWRWRTLARVVPFLLLSVATSLLSLWTQKLALATLTDPQWARTWPERVVTAGVAVWFYLGKLIWPCPVMSLYPRWQFDAGLVSSYLPSVAVVVALFVLWMKRESPLRPLFFAFAYFLVALLPVLGLADNYIFQYALVFDHFQYLPSMGPLALAGAGIARLSDFILAKREPVRWGLYAALLLVLGLLSWQRATGFTSEETLWTDTLSKNPGSWTAHYNLGVVATEKSEMDEAKTHFEAALKLYPAYSDAGVHLGSILLQKGEVKNAIAQFENVLRLDPKSYRAVNDLGDALLKEGKSDEAMAQYQKALAIYPDFPEAECNIGQLLFEKGDTNGAIALYVKALGSNPHLAGAHYDLGQALLRNGRADEALAEFQLALAFDPNRADAWDELGQVLVRKGQVADAITAYRRALAINPSLDSTEGNLGIALFQAGQREEAMDHFRRALKINPRSVQASNNLGNGFLGSGQVDEAIAQYQQTILLDPKFADVRRNLGLALLMKGRPGDAIMQLQEAVRLNPNDRAAPGLLAKAQAMAQQKPGTKAASP